MVKYMKKCYYCGEECVHQTGEEKIYNNLVVYYYCENCGAGIVVYKELEEEDAH